jgi:hypothetical protein
VKHLKDCIFHTDDGDAFAGVLPRGRHIAGKRHAVEIERDNRHTRHPLARFTQRTKVVSKSAYRADITLRIWWAVTTTHLFDHLQLFDNSLYREPLKTSVLKILAHINQ